MSNALISIPGLSVSGAPAPAENAAPSGQYRAYGRLSQRNPEYNAKRLEMLDDLYEGGWKVVDKAKTYTRALVGEHPDRHDRRCEMTSYAPYFGQIVDGFVSDLFNQPLTLKPAPKKAAADGTKPEPTLAPEFYTEFEKDADNQGTAFVEVLGDAMSVALRHRRGIIAIDAPPAPKDAPIRTKADEEALGLDRFYVYELPLAQIIDWKLDKRNRSSFEWCIRWEREQERDSPEGDRSLITETFTVWRMLGAKAAWERYSITYKPEQPPEPNTPVKMVDSDVTPFDRIPIRIRDLPKGLWVGNKIGTQQLEHYQRRSALVGAENNSLVAIPFVAKGPEIPAMGGAIPSEAQQDPGRGDRPVSEFFKKGWVEIGSGDKLDFAEPEGKCYDLVDKQLDDLRKDMFAVNFMMAASVRPTPGAMARSGKSKEKDGEATAKVLRKLGTEARAWAVDIFTTISIARGDDIDWVAHGLDTFESDSREEVLEEAVAVDTINIPSPTFKKAHMLKVARQVLENSDPDTIAKIEQEIDEGVDQLEEHKQLEMEAEAAQTEAKKDVAENPQSHVPAPTAGGPKPPKVPQIGAKKDE